MLLRAVTAAMQKTLGDVSREDPIRAFFRTEVCCDAFPFMMDY